MKVHQDQDENSLIDDHIDPNWDQYGGRADARTREGVPVWALISYLRLVDGDVDETAAAYGLSLGTIEAARVYYRRNKKHIDARILLNTG